MVKRLHIRYCHDMIGLHFKFPTASRDERLFCGRAIKIDNLRMLLMLERNFSIHHAIIFFRWRIPLSLHQADFQTTLPLRPTY